MSPPFWVLFAGTFISLWLIAMTIWSITNRSKRRAVATAEVRRRAAAEAQRHLTVADREWLTTRGWQENGPRSQKSTFQQVAMAERARRGRR